MDRPINDLKRVGVWMLLTCQEDYETVVDYIKDTHCLVTEEYIKPPHSYPAFVEIRGFSTSFISLDYIPSDKVTAMFRMIMPYIIA